MKPQEHEYSSHVAYTRALEDYCNEQAVQIAYLKDFIFDYVDVEPSNEKMLAKYALVCGIEASQALSSTAIAAAIREMATAKMLPTVH